MKIEMSFKDEANILSDLGDIPGEDDDGEEFELDITVTQEILKRTLEPIYQKSIDTCKELLKRNNLSGNTLDSLILVGGPTYSPILRSMLGQQILPPDVSADPMTVVAKGAALFASTIDVAEEIIEQQRDKTKLQLELGYEATTVEQEEFITVKTLKDKMINDTFGKVLVDIVRNDNAWSSGKTEIDGNGEVIEVVLNAAKPNAFNILAYDDRGDLLECEPSNFTIIQGSKIGSATLPYNIGVEIKSSSTGKLVFQSLKGLEKNQTTPAIGTKNGLKTQKQIRPGNSEDFIKIAIYQGQYNSEGSQAIYNEHVYDVLISGEDLPKLLPEGSDVDLTLKVDKSERITGSAYFPSLDYSVDILLPSNTRQAEIDTDWLESELEKAHQSINIIKHEGDHVNADEINKLDSEVSAIKNHFDQARTDYDRKKDVLDSLRSALRRIDEVQSANEWPKIEEEIKDIFYRLEETNSQYGNEKTNTLLEQFREQIPKIIQEQNVKIAQGVIDSMRELDFALIDEGLGAQMEIMYLSHFNEDFDTMDWLDRDRARMTLDRGIQMAANNPIKEELRSVIVELYKLLPDADQKIVGGGDGSELIG